MAIKMDSLFGIALCYAAVACFMFANILISYALSPSINPNIFHLLYAVVTVTIILFLHQLIMSTICFHLRGLLDNYSAKLSMIPSHQFITNANHSLKSESSPVSDNIISAHFVLHVNNSNETSFEQIDPIAQNDFIKSSNLPSSNFVIETIRESHIKHGNFSSNAGSWMPPKSCGMPKIDSKPICTPASTTKFCAKQQDSDFDYFRMPPFNCESSLSRLSSSDCDPILDPCTWYDPCSPPKSPRFSNTRLSDSQFSSFKASKSPNYRKEPIRNNLKSTVAVHVTSSIEQAIARLACESIDKGADVNDEIIKLKAANLLSNHFGEEYNSSVRDTDVKNSWNAMWNACGSALSNCPSSSSAIAMKEFAGCLVETIIRKIKAKSIDQDTCQFDMKSFIQKLASKEFAKKSTELKKYETSLVEPTMNETQRSSPQPIAIQTGSICCIYTNDGVSLKGNTVVSGGLRGNDNLSGYNLAESGISKGSKYIGGNTPQATSDGVYSATGDAFANTSVGYSLVDNATSLGGYSMDGRTLLGSSLGGYSIAGNTTSAACDSIGGSTLPASSVHGYSVTKHSLQGPSVGGYSMGCYSVADNALAGNSVCSKALSHTSVGGYCIGGNATSVGRYCMGSKTLPIISVGGNSINDATVMAPSVGGYSIDSNTNLIGSNSIGGNTISAGGYTICGNSTSVGGYSAVDNALSGTPVCCYSVGGNTMPDTSVGGYSVDDNATSVGCYSVDHDALPYTSAGNISLPGTSYGANSVLNAFTAPFVDGSDVHASINQGRSLVQDSSDQNGSIVHKFLERNATNLKQSFSLDKLLAHDSSDHDRSSPHNQSINSISLAPQDGSIVRRPSFQNGSIVQGSVVQEGSIIRQSLIRDESVIHKFADQGKFVALIPLVGNGTIVRESFVQDDPVVQDSKDNTESVIRELSLGAESVVRLSSARDESATAKSSIQGESIVRESSVRHGSTGQGSSAQVKSILQESSSHDNSIVLESSSHNLSAVQGSITREFTIQNVSIVQETSTHDGSVVQQSDAHIGSMIQGSSAQEGSLIEKSPVQNGSMVEGVSVQEGAMGQNSLLRNLWIRNLQFKMNLWFKDLLIMKDLWI